MSTARNLLLSLACLVLSGCCGWGGGCNSCGYGGGGCSSGACNIGGTAAAPFAQQAYIQPGTATAGFNGQPINTALAPLEPLPTYR
jgi:hypothetical protein